MLFRQGNRLINSRNWAKLVRPEQIVCDSDPNDTMYGKFTYEPLERGYGVTIGNALRRVLLSGRYYGCYPEYQTGSLGYDD